MTDITFKEGHNSAGTSLIGYCPDDVTYADLVACFGEPHSDGDGYKVDAEWVLEFSDGTTATIYNYKTGTNYCGESEGKLIKDHEGSDWHIGGNDEKAVTRVCEALAAAKAKKPKPKKGKPATSNTQAARLRAIDTIDEVMRPALEARRQYMSDYPERLEELNICRAILVNNQTSLFTVAQCLEGVAFWESQFPNEVKKYRKGGV